jgi:hypothetical protein
MPTHKLSNVPVRDFKEFLTKCECKHIKTEGGHEKWTRSDLIRPVIFQTHVDPIPEFIIKANLRTLNLSKQDFFNILFDVK